MALILQKKTRNHACQEILIKAAANISTASTCGQADHGLSSTWYLVTWERCKTRDAGTVIENSFHSVSTKAISIVWCEKAPPSSSLIVNICLPRKSLPNLTNAVLRLELPDVWQVSGHSRFRMLAQEEEQWTETIPCLQCKAGTAKRQLVTKRQTE